MTHSPMPRYLSTHRFNSLLSEIFSDLRLGLESHHEGIVSRGQRLEQLDLEVHRVVGVVGRTYVKPVERLTPARKAETETEH